jgi:hypothetical protein
MTDHFRELDHRSHDRIDVRLLWRERDNRVVVAVADAKTGVRFNIEVRDRERALDVFHHPFAYAAWVGTPTHEPASEGPAVLDGIG